MKDKENEKITEVGEDGTQYGEFVCSYFAWIPLQDQKEKATKLQEMTEDKKGGNNGL